MWIISTKKWRIGCPSWYANLVAWLSYLKVLSNRTALRSYFLVLCSMWMMQGMMHKINNELTNTNAFLFRRGRAPECCTPFYYACPHSPTSRTPTQAPTHHPRQTHAGDRQGDGQGDGQGDSQAHRGQGVRQRDSYSENSGYAATATGKCVCEDSTVVEHWTHMRRYTDLNPTHTTHRPSEEKNILLFADEWLQ